MLRDSGNPTRWKKQESFDMRGLGVNEWIDLLKFPLCRIIYHGVVAKKKETKEKRRRKLLPFFATSCVSLDVSFNVSSHLKSDYWFFAVTPLCI